MLEFAVRLEQKREALRRRVFRALGMSPGRTYFGLAAVQLVFHALVWAGFGVGGAPVAAGLVVPNFLIVFGLILLALALLLTVVLAPVSLILL